MDRAYGWGVLQSIDGYFSSFEAGIGNAIPSLQMTKNNTMYEK